MLLSVASLVQLGAIVAPVEWVRWRYTGKRAGGLVGSSLTGESVRVAPLMTWVCVCLGCLPQMEGAGSLDTMSFPYLSHCLCSIARGFAGVGGVDVAWLGMLTDAFGLAPLHGKLVFALCLLVFSIQ